MGDRRVAIFWDYENCPVPAGSSGHQVVKSIRGAIQPYGSIKVFKAYLAISEQSQAKSLTLRSELQASGVSLTDTPHNGRKDVADKMMIVDMLLYAIDNPAPATLVLISGDRDFAYTVAVLRLRQYGVVVLSPSNAHASLTSHASVCMDWNRNVLASGFNNPPTFASVIPRPVSTGPHGHEAPIPSPVDHPLREVTLETYLDRKPSIVHLAECYRERRTTIPAVDTVPSEPMKRWARLNSVSSSTSFATCDSTTSHFSGDSRSHSSDSERWSELDVTPRYPQPLPSGPPKLASWQMSQRQSAPETSLIEDRVLQPIGLQPRAGETISPPIRTQPLEASLALSSQGSLYSPSTPAQLLEPPGTQADEVENALPPLPSHFKALVKVMQGYCARGIFRPWRPSVAAEVLTEDRNAFDILPSNKERIFSNYAELAVGRGIVDVGGAGRDAWISLHPRYHGMDLAEIP